MATMEQRVSYLEGKIESLATKEDLAPSGQTWERWRHASPTP